MEGANTNESFAELSREMDAAVARIEARHHDLNKQIDDLDALKQNITNGADEMVMVALGAGYFANLARGNALAFVERRKRQMAAVAQQLQQQIAQAQETRKNLATFDEVASQHVKPENQFNEEGLPFMDIVEVLDDDGNVVDAKVNNEEWKPKQFRSEDVVSSASLIEALDDDMEVDQPQQEIKPKIEELNDNDDQVKDEPMMEIREELDDDGNVVSKLVKSVPQTSLEQQFAGLLEDMEVIDKPVSKENLLEKINALDIDDDHKRQLTAAYHDQFDDANDAVEEANDTLDDTAREERGKVLADIIKEHVPEVSESVVNKSVEGSAIDTKDLLELEVLADDFNIEDDEDWEGDWPFDEDEDEDDDNDELLYGKPSYFGNTAANDMLWKQVMERRQNLSMPKISPRTEKKSVRFAPKLEIKEVENISDDLKQMDYGQKQSIFKQRRETFQDDDVDMDDSVLEESVMERSYDGQLEEMAKSTILERSGSVMEDSIMERPMSDSIIERPMSDSIVERPISDSIVEHPVSESVIERSHDITESIIELPREVIVERTIREVGEPEPIIEEPGEKAPKKVSRFKKSRQESRKPQPIIPSDPRGTMISEHGESVEDEVKDATLDYNSLQDDMETMAKAYVLGLYDDDITTEGPVVEELRDFEVINKMVESMAKQAPPLEIKKTKTTQPQYDARSDEVGDFEHIDSDDDDGPLLVDEIIEHDHVEHDQDAMEDEMLHQEIAENYHRLRQKLLYDENGFKKSAKELEFEPIDSEGNTIKVSRFKAARLGKTLS